MAIISFAQNKSLSYDVYGKDKTKTVVFLHGIMASKKNLRTFAECFSKQHDSWSVVVFDLPNHGDSSKDFGPFDIHSIAEIIAKASRSLSPPVKSIVGHSFGAKVALLAALKISSIKSVWMLDCSPGQLLKIKPLDLHGAMNVQEIIDVLENLPWPVRSRADLVERLTKRGVSKGIASWMTTNLIGSPGNLELVFNLDEIKQMLDSFLVTDGWPSVLELVNFADVHLVAAELSGRLNKSDEKKILDMSSKGHFHILKDAGHFLHTDNLSGLLELMQPYF